MNSCDLSGRTSVLVDPTGSRTLMADSTGRYTSTFDAVGQTMVTASPNSQRQTFSYDAIGQRRSMDATGAGRFTYVYDAANQISSLRNPYTERTTFKYDFKSTLTPSSSWFVQCAAILEDHYGVTATTRCEWSRILHEAQCRCQAPSMMDQDTRLVKGVCH